MVEQSGWFKHDRMWIDKGLWDTDRDNDGSSDVMVDISLFDGISTLAAVALTIIPGGQAVAPTILAGMSMAHSTAGLATGHLSSGQWGAEMLQSGLKGLAGSLGNVMTTGGAFASSLFIT